MKCRLIIIAVFLAVGLTTNTILAWSGRAWPIQPLPVSDSLRLNQEERAAYVGFRRPHARLCFALNSVYCTSIVWLVIGGISLVRRRVVNRRALTAPS